MTPNSLNTENPFNILHRKMKATICGEEEKDTSIAYWLFKSITNTPWNVSCVYILRSIHNEHTFEHEICLFSPKEQVSVDICV